MGLIALLAAAADSETLGASNSILERLLMYVGLCGLLLPDVLMLLVPRRCCTLLHLSKMWLMVP